MTLTGELTRSVVSIAPVEYKVLTTNEVEGLLVEGFLILLVIVRVIEDPLGISMDDVTVISVVTEL